jgi:hypothetical protein
MTWYQIKEANRFYWIVKGQLIPESWSEKDIESTYHSYMERIWGNHENGVHATGFEAAWAARQAKKINEKSEKPIDIYW